MTDDEAQRAFGYVSWLLILSLLIELEEGGLLNSDHVHSILRRAIGTEALRPFIHDNSTKEVWELTARLLGIPRKRPDEEEGGPLEHLPS